MPLNAEQLNITQGVTPKRIHSHNDEDRSVPLFDALRAGCGSIEPDILYVDGKVMVAHDVKDVTPERSLRSLYLDPLLEILELHNSNDPQKPQGVFRSAPDHELLLVLDFKHFEPVFLQAVVDLLEPLRSRGWLTHLEGDSLKKSLITVVASGSITLSVLQALENKDIFYDAKMRDIIKEDLQSNWCPVASASIKEFGYNIVLPYREEPLRLMREAVDEARRRGIMTRFWGIPKWPSKLTEMTWTNTRACGEDWLNADDLELAASF